MLKQYLDSIQGQLKVVRKPRERKVEKAILELVTKLVQNNEATTVKRISSELGKKPQQIYQILRQATTIKKVYTGKNGKQVVIVPIDFGEDTTETTN